MDETTNPGDPEVDNENTSAVDGDDADSNDDELADGEQSESSDPPEEYEEYDKDGKKYQVPKALKDDLLRQADYTRKTQEVADLRRQTESERSAVQQLANLEHEHLQDLANLRMVDNVLSKYQGADWQRMSAENPAETQARWIDYQQAQDARRTLSERISQQQQQRGLSQQQDLAKRVQESEAALAGDDKTWSETRSAALSSFIQKQYGMSRDQLAQAMSPAFARLMRDAMTGRQALTKATAKPPAAPVTPVPVLRANTPTNRSLHDGLPIDEWMRRFQTQSRKRT